jgi:internalin A
MERQSVIYLIAQAADENWKRLDLSGRHLSDLPPEISQLTNITSLDLSFNQFNALPESIGNLSNLRHLNLSSIQLRALPKSIANLKSLTSLDLRSNQFKTLPEEICQLKNLTNLNLCFNKIITLPKDFFQLSNLIALDLSGNQFNTLPKDFFQLSDLITLNLNGNQFKVFPEVFFQFEKLTSVRFSGNQLSKIPESIENLKVLTILDLRDNQLNTLPESFGNLTKITSLDLRNNQITDLPDSLGNLTQIISLDLRNNQITSLPESIGQLSSLTFLDIRNNQIKALPDSISQLRKLVNLNIGNNRIKSLPETFCQLSNIVSLDLSSNQINTLPEAIGQLENLTSLQVNFNQLNALPVTIGQLENLTSLIISNNPLSRIPPEIVQKGGLAVRDYYRQQLEESLDYIYEAKLLIIGEGGAGKTSLANKLIDSEYKLKLEGGENPEKSTEGIDVIPFNFRHISGKSFRINIWDFGGQEIYHATHQFFLTKRSLYLLVADTRQDNTDFNYWLEVIELLSEASPTIIVKNEKQDRPCQINENQLRGRFTNLEKILPTNLFDNRGFPEILTAVQHHISQLPHVGTPLPKTWVRVREALEANTRNYITQTEFLNLCDNHGFKRREDKMQLSGYLHDLGVCLHFQDDPVLKNWVILKPEWGTTAVYKVLDTPKVQKSLGYFTHEDLAKIWADEQYIDMRDELLQLMMRFKLCYEIPHRPHTYIAPQLLSPNQPEYAWDDTDNLILRYHYDFMPKGMLTHFTVEMHRLIDSDLVWKEGVILADNSSRATVIETYSKNEIRIRVSGFPKKDLLTRIRHEFDKIHDSYEKLRYQELIPCNCPTCKGSQNPHSYVLKKLQERLENEAYETECDQKPYHKVNVRNLIDDAIGNSQKYEFFSEGLSLKSDQEVPERIGRQPTPSTLSVIIQNHINNTNQTEQVMSGDKIWTGDRIDGDKVMGDKDTVLGNKVRMGDVTGDVIAGNKIVNTQDLAQAAKDIKALINQLSPDYDTTTPSGKRKVTDKILEALEGNTTIQSRALKALKEAGKAALEEAIDHPIAKVLVAGLEGYLE